MLNAKEGEKTRLLKNLGEKKPNPEKSVSVLVWSAVKG
jgi:hypothetical protein